MNFIKKHIDFKPYLTTLLSFITALAIIPCLMFLPDKFGYENGLLENLQMVVLFLGLYFAFSSKINRKFFFFVGLVLTILMLREVNCGRTLFFPVPGVENAFYTWKQIKYGYLAHPIFGIYIASVAIYFLWNKLFINLWNIIKSVRFPIWDISFMILGMALGLYAEHATENFVFEEISELLFYVALVGIIWLYSRHKNFAIKEND